MSKADKRERQRQNRELAKAERERLMKRDRRMRSARGLLFVLIPVIAVFVFFTFIQNSGSSSKSSVSCSTTKPPQTKKDTNQQAPAQTIDVTKTYTATMKTSCGTFTIGLAAAEAPKTVNSFVHLARQGFYDGLTFHRIAKDFVVQGGDPKGDGSGGPGYKLPTEPPANGYKKGSVAMANSGPDTTGSQFFLVLSANGAKALGGPPYLYSGLGTVTNGMNVVEKLGSLYNKNQTPSDPASQKTSQPLYIDKVTINES